MGTGTAPAWTPARVWVLSKADQAADKPDGTRERTPWPSTSAGRGSGWAEHL